MSDLYEGVPELTPEEEDEIAEEEDPTCCEGFHGDECCRCDMRFAIEHCEFMCPFGGPGYRCGGKGEFGCSLERLEMISRKGEAFREAKEDTT